MSLKKRLINAAKDAVTELKESSAEMIQNNITPGFDGMDIASAAPGEFAQGEITDAENLINKADMANDTDFNKDDAACDDAVIVSTTVTTEMPGEVNISATEEETTEEDEVEKSLFSKMLESVLDGKTPVQYLTEVNPVANPEYPEHLVKPWLSNILKKAIADSLDIQTIGQEIKDNDNADYLYNTVFDKLQEYATTFEEKQILEVLINNIEGGAFTILEGIMHVLNHPELEQRMVDTWLELYNTFINGVEEASKMPWDDINFDWADEENENIGILDDTEANLLSPKNTYAKSIFDESTEVLVNKLKTIVETGYAGPLDFVPDTRINVSDVVRVLKNEIGEGSEGIHVDQEYDERKNNVYKVSQIDKDKLPKKLHVENLILELDGDTYIPNKISSEFPFPK